MNRRGFTLLEILVVITVASISLVILATATRSQARSAVFQIGTADMNQNVRSGLDLFTREVRMAGFGMTAVPTNVLAPVEVLHTADPLTVVLRANYANVTSTGFGTASTVALDATAPALPRPFTVGEKVAIYSEILGVAEARTITAYNSATRVITVSPNLTQVYDPGSPINQLNAVTYRLDGASVLWRGTDPVADQVSILQLSYVLQNGTAVADPVGNLDKLRAATFRMKSQKVDQNGLRPQAEFSTEVRIRNLAIAGTPEES
jgi:prepilin-type N-terminal cleavage/methylation domain-containing protein